MWHLAVVPVSPWLPPLQYRDRIWLYVFRLFWLNDSLLWLKNRFWQVWFAKRCHAQTMHAKATKTPTWRHIRVHAWYSIGFVWTIYIANTWMPVLYMYVTHTHIYTHIYIYIQYITAVISEIDVYRSSNPTAPSVHPIHLLTYPSVHMWTYSYIFHMQHMHLIAKSPTAALAGIWCHSTYQPQLTHAQTCTCTWKPRNTSGWLKITASGNICAHLILFCNLSSSGPHSWLNFRHTLWQGCGSQPQKYTSCKHA